MARFLRDEQLSSLTIDAEAISQLVDALFARWILVPEYLASQQNQQPPDVILMMTIRFDRKGYRVFTKEDLLKYFNEASHVERVVFELMSGDSFRSNKANGSYLDLRLDNNELQPSHTVSCSDDENWMNGSFSLVQEILQKNANKHWLARNPIIELVLQLTGLFAGFLISLWGASSISPSLQIENSFLISFLLVLLIFSSLWGFINLRLRGILSKAFPSITFYRSHKEKLNWLFQALVGGLVVAATLFLMNLGFNYVGKTLGAFVGAGA